MFRARISIQFPFPDQVVIKMPDHGHVKDYPALGHALAAMLYIEQQVIVTHLIRGYVFVLQPIQKQLDRVPVGGNAMRGIMP